MATSCIRLDQSGAAPAYLWVGANGTHLKLSPSAYHLLSSIAAGVSAATIAAALTERQGRTVTAAEVEAAHQTLVGSIRALEQRPRQPPAGFWLRLPCLPAGLVAHLARWLAVAYQPVVAGALLALILVMGWLTLQRGWPVVEGSRDFWLGYLLFVLSLIGHELGHASAAQRFGAPPREIGFALYWGLPVFYSDVSAAWRLRRWQRVIVDLGGVYFQLIVAAGLLLIDRLWAWPPLLIASTMIISTSLVLLSPVLKFDGYWLVADGLGVTNLGQQPARLVRHGLARLRRQPVPALPWPIWVTLGLSLYTLLTAGFAFVIAGQLGRAVWAYGWHYPSLLGAVVSALLTPPHWPAGEALLALGTASYLLLIGTLFTRSLLQLLWSPLAAAWRRRWPGHQPVETR